MVAACLSSLRDYQGFVSPTTGCVANGFQALLLAGVRRRRAYFEEIVHGVAQREGGGRLK